MKLNKKWMIITTLICLLPIFAGLAVYGKLPEQVPTHFGFDGTPDGWSSKAVAVFGMPCLMAAINLLLYFGLNADPKKKNMGEAMVKISLGVVPVLSVLMSGMTLANALGYNTNIEMVIPLLMGVLFILIGNYLPKTKQSYTMGIKLPWTLNSEENWNRTHRMAGFLWVAGGVVFVAVSLLKIWNVWIFAGILAVMVLIPTVYSYLLYKKGI